MSGSAGHLNVTIELTPRQAALLIKTVRDHVTPSRRGFASHVADMIRRGYDKTKIIKKLQKMDEYCLKMAELADDIEYQIESDGVGGIDRKQHNADEESSNAESR